MASLFLNFSFVPTKSDKDLNGNVTVTSNGNIPSLSSTQPRQPFGFIYNNDGLLVLIKQTGQVYRLSVRAKSFSIHKNVAFIICVQSKLHLFDLDVGKFVGNSIDVPQGQQRLGDSAVLSDCYKDHLVR